MLKVTIKGEPQVCGWKKIGETEGVDRKRSKKMIVIVKTCTSLGNASVIPSFFLFKSVFSNPDHGLKMLYVLMWLENMKVELVNLLLSKSPRSDSKD